MMPSLCKLIWQVLIKLNIYISHDSAIPLPGMHPGEKKTYVHN